MGLVLLDSLLGEEMAQVAHLAIGYDPRPPFDAASPSQGWSELGGTVRALLASAVETAAPAPT